MLYILINVYLYNLFYYCNYLLMYLLFMYPVTLKP